MALYIETKLRYDKLMENGSVKPVTERFIVDALSFTEAEAKIIEARQPYMSGEFSVSAVKKTKISEIHRDENGDRFYLAKLAFITIDEKTATEKKAISQMLVEASDFESAYKNLMSAMKGTMADFEVVSIAESPVIDVYGPSL